MTTTKGRKRRRRHISVADQRLLDLEVGGYYHQKYLNARTESYKAKQRPKQPEIECTPPPPPPPPPVVVLVEAQESPKKKQKKNVKPTTAAPPTEDTTQWWEENRITCFQSLGQLRKTTSHAM